MCVYALKSEDYYRNFKESIKSKYTLAGYDSRLNAFMRFKGIKVHNYGELIEAKDSREIEADIINFLIFLKNRHYSLASQQLYLAALIHFFSINDVSIRRKKIAKFMSNDDIADSAANQAVGDKPYTREQIATMLSFADLRTRAIILLYCSSGMRLGALETLKIGDLIPIPTHNIYQITVYAHSKSSRHYTFCTPECRKALDNYIDFRKSAGEVITPKSPVIRRAFDKRDVFAAAHDIKHVTVSSIKTTITNLVYNSGIRVSLVCATKENANLPKLNYRRETSLTHGFRKFFDTTCTNSGMNPIYIEWCMGHKLEGVKDSYFLPQPNSDGIYLDVLEGHNKSPGYLDAIYFLTINEENRLKRKVKELSKKGDQIEELQRYLLLFLILLLFHS